ncbi:hypothetical protein PVAP13_8NG153300 [Panicum virgatum]|uniref:Uncharacterized protein n=1 Tax=Panicum virgatum TaxID=38727 RepID=A0A8T0P4V0_PANVG|nr:hypothetical protein PVAP13_8NG153300 [Panicum virgatum]
MKKRRCRWQGRPRCPVVPPRRRVSARPRERGGDPGGGSGGTRGGRIRRRRCAEEHAAADPAARGGGESGSGGGGGGGRADPARGGGGRADPEPRSMRKNEEREPGMGSARGEEKLKRRGGIRTCGVDGRTESRGWDLYKISTVTFLTCGHPETQHCGAPGQRAHVRPRSVKCQPTPAREREKNSHRDFSAISHDF